MSTKVSAKAEISAKISAKICSALHKVSESRKSHYVYVSQPERLRCIQMYSINSTSYYIERNMQMIDSKPLTFDAVEDIFYQIQAAERSEKPK
jgi:myo-inositol catabolism protein IolC